MKFAWGNDAPDYYLSKKLLYGMLAGSERYADSTDRSLRNDKNTLRR